MQLNREQQRIVDLAKSLYGVAWQSPFSRATGISQTLLSFVANGLRDVTGETRDRVIAGLRSEVKTIRKRAAEVAAAVADYEKE